MSGKTFRLWGGLFLVCSLIFLSHYFFAGEAIYGDGIDYWANLHTWYIDKNLDYTNEFRHLYSPENNSSKNDVLAPVPLKTRITDTGRTDNPHPPGTAILWLPAYVIGDLMARLWGVPNGYSNLYQLTVGLATIAYVTAGLWVMYVFCRRLTGDKRISLLSALGILVASPLLYYGTYDVINSHALSFFVSAYFWYKWWFFNTHEKWGWDKLVLMAALAINIRLGDITLAIPLLWIILRYPAGALKRVFRGLITMMLISWPMVWQWVMLYGKPWPETYLAFGHKYNGILGVMFHPTNGLVRTPILILALGGLSMIKKFPRLRIMTIVLLINLMLVIMQGGWQDAAYGARMFTANFPLLILSLGLLLKSFRIRFGLKSVAVVVGVLAIINIVSITSFVLLEKQVNSGQRRGLEEHAIQKWRQIINGEWD